MGEWRISSIKRSEQEVIELLISALTEGWSYEDHSKAHGSDCILDAAIHIILTPPDGGRSVSVTYKES